MATVEIPCEQCAEVFTFETGPRVGRSPTRCPVCRPIREREINREKQYRWRAAHPEMWRATQARANAKRLADPEHLRQKRENEAKRLYGIGPEALLQLTESQGGICAICGGNPGKIGRRGHHGRLHIDHDHATGRVRGLLCGNCNTMIGLAGEDPEILRKAIEYLGR